MDAFQRPAPGEDLQLVDSFPAEKVFWPANTWPNLNKKQEQLLGYELPGGLFVVGPYKRRSDGSTGCGGADRIYGGPHVQIAFVERAAAKYPYIYWESLMATLTASKNLVAMRDRVPGHVILAPTLDTPRDVCLERMLARRNAPGSYAKNRKPLNVGTTIDYAHKRTHILRQQLLDAGFDAPLVPYERPFESVVELLLAAGWKG